MYRYRINAACANELLSNEVIASERRMAAVRVEEQARLKELGISSAFHVLVMATDSPGDEKGLTKALLIPFRWRLRILFHGC